ncbi:anaerobic sulfatase-maturation protein [Alistipes sp.]|uniref:anaerobic sulfatase-maturation protein n=1 Tax=Alistipes sp. TaxID=1872444 RepID=UPI003A843FA9
MDEILSYQQYVRPFYVMAKPAGARCNLRCAYCYYLEKSNLYTAAPAQTMSDELLERFIREYIEAQAGDEVIFSWHGGETLLRSRDFYRRALELQRRYAAGRRIENSIQTNGTLLDDAWCAFFRENNFLVGISLDGTAEMHDRYRLDRQGSPTFEAVMRGVRLLQKHGVEWNALAVVNRHNADDPVGFYRFFRSIGCRYLQFTPVVERILPHDDGRQLASAAEAGAPLADFSVTPEQWGRFTCALFDQWVVNDVGRIFVQLFDATLANWVGQAPGVCTLSKNCGHAGALEFNGDLYACDHFVFPEYRLGNILETPLTELMRSPRQTAFGDAKLLALPAQCRRCRYLFACNGECPRNRFERTREGEPGLNYLCKGYQRFFSHVEPYMDFMRNELMHQRAPANVMEWARRRKKSGR